VFFSVIAGTAVLGFVTLLFLEEPKGTWPRLKKTVRLS